MIVQLLKCSEIEEIMESVCDLKGGKKNVFVVRVPKIDRSLFSFGNVLEILCRMHSRKRFLIFFIYATDHLIT